MKAENENEIEFEIEKMEIANRITHITILCQVLQNYLGDDLANGVFSKNLKTQAKNFIWQLQQVEKDQYNDFFDKAENSTSVIYDIMDAFFIQISNVQLPKMAVVSSMIKAESIDEKSMGGMTKKILKYGRN